ncbi:type II toxin-antitoxin system PemK/MazF family toxin, partial [Burkholderia cepacia]
MRRKKAGNPIGIGAVRQPDRSPPTPPGMRVRTGRFEQLRS